MLRPPKPSSRPTNHDAMTTGYCDHVSPDPARHHMPLPQRACQCGRMRRDQAGKVTDHEPPAERSRVTGGKVLPLPSIRRAG